VTGILPSLCLVRHADTDWSTSGRYTGRADPPLSAAGALSALGLGARLRAHAPGTVYSSPLARAWRTCELAGFGATAQRDDDLVEWDYGAYEGLTTAGIVARRPGWQLFRDGCPGGESPAEVVVRARRVLARFHASGASTTLFSSGHLLRVLATTWLGLDVELADHLPLGPASISLLGYNHSISTPAICLWNDRASFIAPAVEPEAPSPLAQPRPPRLP
jgi:probable phosphoglycerate mutase